MSLFLKFMKLYRLPTGRRLFAVSRVAELAGARGLRELSPWLAAALEHDKETRRLELAWRGSRGLPVHGPKAMELDVELDRSIGALSDALAAQTKGFGPRSPRGMVAVKLQEQVFPDGAFAITSLTYVEQHETVSLLVKRLRDPEDLAQWVRQVETASYVDRIAELNQKYGAELNQNVPSFTYEALREAQGVGQRNLARIVVLVLALFAEDSEEHVALREELLGPVVTQNEAVRLHRRRRRTVGDVDPTTGEEEEGELERLGEPATSPVGPAVSRAAPAASSDPVSAP